MNRITQIISFVALALAVFVLIAVLMSRTSAQMISAQEEAEWLKKGRQELENLKNTVLTKPPLDKKDPKMFQVTFTIRYDSLTLLSASQIEMELRRSFPVPVDVTVSEIVKPPVTDLWLRVDSTGSLWRPILPWVPKIQFCDSLPFPIHKGVYN